MLYFVSILFFVFFFNFKTKASQFIQQFFWFVFSFRFSIFDLQFWIRRIQYFHVTKACTILKSVCSFYFRIFYSLCFIKKNSYFVVSPCKAVVEFLLVFVCKILEPFKCKPHKIIKHTQTTRKRSQTISWQFVHKQFISKLPTDCLSVFEHFAVVKISFDKVVGHLFSDPMSLVTQQMAPWLTPIR